MEQESQNPRIYTKTGDTGMTSFVGGERVSKDDPRIEAYGILDELNSILGLTMTFVEHAQVRLILEKAQHDLFTLCAELASISPRARNLVLPKMTYDHGRELEKYIDDFSSRLVIQGSFILPGGTRASAFLHLTRTVCRRGERVVVGLAKQFEINQESIRYLNRLSDLLYVLARFENKEVVKEQQPIYKYFEKRE